MPGIQRDPNRPPTHPGELLREDVLPELEVNQTTLAQLLGVSRMTIHQVLNGHRALTAALAVKIEDELGVSADLLMSMQQALDLWKARNAARQARSSLLSSMYTYAQGEALDVISRARVTSAASINLPSSAGLQGSIFSETKLTAG